MIKYIFLFIALICSSCSVIKKIRKDKEKESEKTELKTDTQTDTQLLTKDFSHSKIITTERLDSIVKVGGTIQTGSVLLSDVERAPVQVGDSSENVTLSIDHKTGKLNVVIKEAAKKIPIKFNRTIEKEVDNNIVTASNKKEDIKQELKQEKKSKVQTTDRDIKKTTLVPWWAWIILIVIVVIYVGYRFLKFYIKPV